MQLCFFNKQNIIDRERIVRKQIQKPVPASITHSSGAIETVKGAKSSLRKYIETFLPGRAVATLQFLWRLSGVKNLLQSVGCSGPSYPSKSSKSFVVKSSQTRIQRPREIGDPQTSAFLVRIVFSSNLISEPVIVMLVSLQSQTSASLTLLENINEAKIPANRNIMNRQNYLN